MPGIDVANHLWVSVCAASFVQQYADYGRRLGSPGSAAAHADRFMEEAMAVADVAVESWQTVTFNETRDKVKAAAKPVENAGSGKGDVG